MRATQRDWFLSLKGSHCSILWSQASILIPATISRICTLGHQWRPIHSTQALRHVTPTSPSTCILHTSSSPRPLCLTLPSIFTPAESPATPESQINCWNALPQFPPPKILLALQGPLKGTLYQRSCSITMPLEIYSLPL